MQLCLLLWKSWKTFVRSWGLIFAQLCLLLWKSWKTFVRSWGWIFAQGAICFLIWALFGYLLYDRTSNKVKSLEESLAREPIFPSRDMRMIPRMRYARDDTLRSHPYDRIPSNSTSKIAIQATMQEINRICEEMISDLKLLTFYYYDEESFFVWRATAPYLFPIFLFCVQASMEVTQESNSFMKDYLLSMGMNRLLYFLHHFIFHFMKGWIHVIVTSLIIGGIHGNMGVAGFLILIFSLFLATFISISLLLGSVFKKPAVSVIISVILWVGMIVADAGFVDVKRTNGLSLLASLSPLQAILQTLGAKRESAIPGYSVFEKVCLAKTFRYYSEEKVNETLLVEEFVNRPKEYAYGYYLLMLGFNAVFHFFLAIGVDWLRNSFENPIALLRRAKKCEAEESKRLLEGNMEKRKPRGEIADIVLEGVHKIYSSGEHAVRGVDMSVRKGQVTALLGHNGAGKSTTFSMISGMTVPTRGRIFVMGKEGNGDKQKLIGYCPQYNPIFPKLTVDEHLKFFARLKGVKDWQAIAYRVLTCLEMAKEGDTRAITLSGGMKRKLCMAISMAADPPIVLLDEPTAGLDPGARRDFERLLMEWKKEHTILLTTHYTDEAELLADRIFIMARGKVFCSGSPQFLRKKFDSGYILSFAVSNESESEKASMEMVNLVKEFVPDVSVCKLRGKQFELKLSTDDSKRFVEMFRKIEEIGPSFGMQSYGLSLTKLEQVFLKVGELTGTHDRKEEVQTALKELIQENGNRTTGIVKIMQQFLYTLLKRLQFDLTHIPSLVLNLLFIYAIGYGFMYLAAQLTPVPETKYEIELDMPYERELDMPYERELDMSYERELDMPYERELDMPYERELDMPYERELDMPYERELDMPYERELDMPYERELDMPYFGKLDKKKSPLEILYPLLLSVMAVLASPFMVIRPLAFLIIERTCNFAHQERLTGFSRVVLLAASILYDCLFFLLSFAAIFGGSMTASVEATKAAISTIVFKTSIAFASGELLILLLYRRFATRAKGEVSIILILLGSTLAAIIYTYAMIQHNSCYDRPSCTGYLYTFSICPIYAFSPVLDILMWNWEMTSKRSIGKIAGPVFLILHFGVLIFIFSIVELRKLCQRKSCTMQPGDDVVLRVDNLRKVYQGGKVAVNNISFGVRAHECFGVLGVNGAGKSSTFEILTGNTQPSGGSASVNGVDCGRAPTIGYCPQADALIEHLTGRQSLVILAALHGYAKPNKVADIVITCVGMQEHANRATGRYSGGQRRKISVAASLLAQNSLIILDEPTAGIDPITRRDVWSVICALRENTNTAVVLTSHSMDEVEALVSNLIILRKGSIVVEGSPQMIKNQYGGHYNLNLVPEVVTDVAEITTKVVAVFPEATLYDSASLKNIKYRIPRVPSDIFSTLFEKAAAIAEQIRVTDFSFTQATLEDAFMLASSDQPVMLPPPFGQPQFGQPQFGVPQYGQPYGFAPPPQGVAWAPVPGTATTTPTGSGRAGEAAAAAAATAPSTDPAAAPAAAPAPEPVGDGTETVTQTGAETGTTGV